MSTSPPRTHYQIKRKPPPPHDISEKYPSPDPSDPFASLSALRNRTTSGLESDIVNRARSDPHLYSTTTAQVPANIVSMSPIPSFPNPKLGHYRFNINGLFLQAFPPISNKSSPLAFQPDLLHRELPSTHRHTKVRFPRRTYDLNDSGTESDDNFVPPQVMPNTAFVHQPSSIYHFPRTSLLKTTSFPSSGNKTTGNRSSKVALKQAQKSAAVSTAVTWIPSRVGSDFINSRTTSKFASSLPADLLNCGSLTLASDENHHPHHHSKRHPMPSDGRENLKQDLPRPLKHSSISISPMMLLRKRRASASRPFSFTTASPNRTSSTFSYVQISMPTLISSTPQHEAAYTSPRKAPAPPPVSTSPKQGQECPDKSCKLGNYCIHSISSEWGLPSPLQLNYASHLPITGEDGKQVTFGSLFESQPTIVIFIRHFWCPLCQDYMSSVNSFLGPKTTCENGHRDIKGFAALGHDAETPVRFVVISNGAHGMIAKYRQIFGLFFKVYTDPSLALYRALGMGRDGDIRKHHNRQTHRHSTSVDSSISEKNSDNGKPGEYVKHSLMGGIAMVVMRALKVGMPVWEKGGDVNQLGGEFVFGPG